MTTNFISALIEWQRARRAACAMNPPDVRLSPGYGSALERLAKAECALMAIDAEGLTTIPGEDLKIIARAAYDSLWLD